MIRLRNAKFISEFTKFKLFPLKKLFLIFHKLCLNFSPLAIRTLACLLENCGRWLYLNPTTHARLIKTIELIKQKQKVTYLQQNLENFIENAIYFVTFKIENATYSPPLQKKVKILLKAAKKVLKLAKTC